MFSRTPEEHIDEVKLVPSLLHDARVTLKLKKCKFITDTIDYLNHVIRQQRLETASNTTNAIRGLQLPTLLADLRPFFDLCNKFRRFVANFVRLAAALNNRLQKDQPATFGTLNDEEISALDALKNALALLPVLTLPNFTNHRTLDTEACAARVGCVLLQKKFDDTIRPLNYWSRTLYYAQRCYNTTQKECLAFV